MDNTSEEAIYRHEIQLAQDNCDTRPQRGWWAPGHYFNRCGKCGTLFIGDKRAGRCAPCAYVNKEHSP